MDTRYQQAQLIRLAIFAPIAIFLLAYTASTEGWGLIAHALKIFVPGVLVLVPLFKWLGLWR